MSYLYFQVLSCTQVCLFQYFAFQNLCEPHIKIKVNNANFIWKSKTKKMKFQNTCRGPNPIAENLSFISWTVALSHRGILPSGSGSWASVRPKFLSNKLHWEYTKNIQLINYFGWEKDPVLVLNYRSKEISIIYLCFGVWLLAIVFYGSFNHWLNMTESRKNELKSDSIWGLFFVPRDEPQFSDCQ